MVDLRPDSPTRNEWLGVELSARSGRLAYVPEGFAQGYQTLEDDTEVLYQMSHHYVPEAARGVRWDDPAWVSSGLPPTERIISERDCGWPEPSPDGGRRHEDRIFNSRHRYRRRKFRSAGARSQRCRRWPRGHYRGLGGGAPRNRHVPIGGYELPRWRAPQIRSST